MGLRKNYKVLKKLFLNGEKKLWGVFFYVNFDNLSDNQKKMIRDLYFDYIRDGLKHKEAKDKAFQIVTCFKM